MKGWDGSNKKKLNGEMKEVTKPTIFLFWATSFFKKKEKRTLGVQMEMEKNGAKGKHWQLKGSPLSVPMSA